MLTRGLALSLTSLLALGVMAGSALADHRKHPRRAMAYDRYYAGPKIVHGVPGLRLFFGDYALSEEEFDALYGSKRDFDESYYEPEPASPAKRKAKPSKKRAIAAPAVQDSGADADADDVTTATIDPAKRPVSKPKITQPQDEDTAAAAAPAVAGLSCDKAGTIVTGYGFSGVKAQSCKGKVYAFNATRDGKSFAIKLDAASGELTEVKKLP